MSGPVKVVPKTKTSDDVRCGVCGVLWKAHTDGCSRHVYRPGVVPDAGTEALMRVEFTGKTRAEAARRRALIVLGAEAPSGLRSPDVGTKGALSGRMIDSERYPAAAGDSELLNEILDETGRARRGPA